MLDTHAVARSLADAEFTPAQADAITAAVLQAAEHAGGDDHQLAAIDERLSRLDARIDERLSRLDVRIDGRLSRLDARIDALTWRFAAAMAAQTLAIIGAVFALMRMFPPA